MIRSDTLHSCLPPDRERVSPAAPIRNWVVTPFLGESSEPWLYRQIVGQKILRPQVICWGYRNAASYPLLNIPVHIQKSELNADESGGKWLRRIRSARSGNFYGAIGAERRTLAALLNKTRPQVILCHFGHMALRLLPLSEAHQVPLVAHFHGLDVSSSLRNRWYRWSLLNCLSRFSAIVVVGSHQRQWMLDQGVPPEKVHLIPCGVPTQEFMPVPRPTRSIVRFLTVSRLSESKGLSYTLQAYARVQREKPNTELVIVGDGPERAALERLARELQLRGVSFRGALAADVVRDEMQQADVFMQHSIVNSSGSSEGFGVSISEAMSMELPVIATRIGGIMDQVSHEQTGLLVTCKDIDGMAAAMLKLAADPASRQSFGVAGRQRVVEHFDARRQIGLLEEVLLRAVKQQTV